MDQTLIEPVIRGLVKEFGDRGFGLRGETDMRELIDDVETHDRLLNEDVVLWFRAYGKTPTVTGPGVKGFTPSSVGSALEWRRIMRGNGPVSDWLASAFVPVLEDSTGTTVLAYLPLKNQGLCRYSWAFAKFADSQQLTATLGFETTIVMLLYDLPEGVPRGLPPQLSDES